MNEAVDRVLLEREQLDRGFSQSLGVSAVVHGLILIAGLIAPLIFPAGPVLQVADGFTIALPPGGGGVPAPPKAEPAPAAPAPPVTTAPEPDVPAPDIKKIVKPPKEEPRKGLPELDAKTKKRKDRERPMAQGNQSRTATTSATSQTPGIAFQPSGPGVPGGMDPNGDWYLAGVQRKIWMLWNQELRGAAHPPAIVQFTILADGSVSDVQVIQRSGNSTVDSAAQRAIYTAAPFAPLPKHYGTNAFTLKAVFKPED